MAKEREIILIFFIMALFSNIINVSALNRDTSKIQIDYCDYALSSLDVSKWDFEDPNNGIKQSEVFFEPWDEGSQEGIFMKSKNLDPSFETSSIYTHNITRYTGQNRAWFNELEGYDGTYSNIPLFNVGPGIDKYLYVRCYFIVNDEYDILLYHGGNTLRSFATTDFNLSIGINNLFNMVSIQGPSEGPMVEPPKVKAGLSNWLYNFDNHQKTAWNNLNEIGFRNPSSKKYLYKGTRPYAIYSNVNLNTIPTSYVALSLNWAIREAPSMSNNLVHCPLNFRTTDIRYTTPAFYINNSDPKFNFNYLLRPRVLSSETIKIMNEDESNKIIGSGGHFNISRGNRFNITLLLENTYPVPINISFNQDIRLCSFESQRKMDYGMLLKSYPSIGPIEFGPYPSPNSKINLSLQYQITDDPNRLIPCVYAYLSWQNVNDPRNPKSISAHSLILGSDNYPYLLADIMNGKIDGEINNKGEFVSKFIINQRFLAASSIYNLNISPGDYELVLELYNHSSRSEEYKIWNTSEVLGSEVKKHKDYQLLSPNQYVDQIFEVPINLDWVSSGSLIYFKIFSRSKSPLQPQFFNQAISEFDGTPHISPGSILFQYNDELVFRPNSTIDIARLELFNPSRYDNKFNLSITDITDKENFTFSFDGTNFGDKYKILDLYPYESKTLNIWVMANYSVWPNERLDKDSLSITASSEEFIDYQGDLNPRTNYSDFNLTVEIEDEEFIDLVPDSYLSIPTQSNLREAIYLDNSEAIVRNIIRVYWFEEGSNEGFEKNTGKEYKVRVSLLRDEDSDGNLKEILVKTSTYKIGNARGRIYQEFSHLFNYSNKDYWVRIELDIEGAIDEKTAKLEVDEAKLDNIRTFMLPTIISGCEYNSSEYFMTRRDNYWSEEYIDQENICRCPIERIPIFDQGYCLDPNSLDCAGISSATNCNDWNYTRVNESGSACFWNSTNCLNCNSILHTCGDYNNESSCNADPCQKADLYDCDAVSCNNYNLNKCYWNSSNGGKCMLNTTVLGDQNCLYEIKIPQRCSDGVARINIEYITSTPNCLNHTREFVCGLNTTTISFFTITNLIASIILTALFYLVLEIKNKRKK